MKTSRTSDLQEEIAYLWKVAFVPKGSPRPNEQPEVLETGTPERSPKIQIQPVSVHATGPKKECSENPVNRTSSSEGKTAASDMPASEPAAPRVPAVDLTTCEQGGQEECRDGPTPRTMPCRNRIAFVALLFTVMAVNSTFSLLAPTLPPEAERRGLSPAMTGLIFSIYSFCNFFASIIHGRVLQQGVIERRTMLVLGLILSAISNAGFAVSNYIPDKVPALFATVLLVLRMVNGVGAAAVDTSSTAIVSQLFRDSEYFGTALGVLESCLAVGWMVGPLAGGYLSAWGGFSGPFYGAAIVVALLLPFSLLVPKKAETVNPVVRGTVRVHPWEFLKNVEIGLFMLVTVLSAAAVTFLDATLAPFLQHTEGFSSSTIGICFAVIAASYAISSAVAGVLCDLTSPTVVIIIGEFLCVVPFALLGPSPLIRPLLDAAGLQGTWHMWLSLALLGSGCALSLMPVLPAILAAADKAKMGRCGIEDLASGIVGGAYYLGGGAGPLLGGAATAVMGFEWASTAYGIGLLLLSVFLVGTIIALIMKQRHKEAEELSEPADEEQPLLSDADSEESDFYIVV